jgi:hypothetical protein
MKVTALRGVEARSFPDQAPSAMLARLKIVTSRVGPEASHLKVPRVSFYVGVITLS